MWQSVCALFGWNIKKIEFVECPECGSKLHIPWFPKDLIK